jgi:hypothetical protein
VRVAGERRSGTVCALNSTHQRLDCALAGLHRLLRELRQRSHNATESARDALHHLLDHLRRLVAHALHLLCRIGFIGWEFGSGVGRVFATIGITLGGTRRVTGDADIAGGVQ